MSTHAHWTRGRILALGLISLTILGMVLWGVAGADIVANPQGRAVSISGFPGGAARVLANVEYDFNVSLNPAALGNFDAYRLTVYGGTRAEMVADMPTMVFNVGDTASSCRQGFDLADFNPSYVISDEVGLNNTATNLPFSLNFKTGGQGYVFAVLSGYNYDDMPVLTMTGQEFCTSGKITTQVAATNFPVEAESWGCERGICIINVNPTTAPAGSSSSRYQIYISGMDRNYKYAFVTGRYEPDNIESTPAANACKAVIDHVTGSGANLATGGQTVNTVDPATVGSAYLSSQFSTTFNSTAQSKRLVAYLLRFDRVDTIPNDNTACAGVNIISAAGWKYDAAGGAGTGGTANPAPKPATAKIDTSGGFKKTNLVDQPITGSSGFFLSGVCATGSNIEIELSNSQGKVDLNNAGLMGICTPNIGGQILKLLMILAAFFFTTTVIISGIAMVRATDGSALETAKKNLIASAIGAFLVIFANWIVPAFISIISKIFA